MDMTIKQRQLLLAYLGYYTGEIDGEWGSGSEAATRAFQEDFGDLEVDGDAGSATQKALKQAVASGMPDNKAFWADIKYFDRDEFKCHCDGKYCDGHPVEMKATLIRVADRVREHFGAPCNVSSGIRCEKHNVNVGGVDNSRHKLGKAMDFCISGKTASEVLAYVEKQPEIRYCYAIDNYYVHMDIK